MIEVILAACLVILPLFIWRTTRNFDYWKKRKVPNPTPIPIFGNFAKLALFKSNLGGITTQIYRDYPEERYVGAFLGSEPVLVVRDPEILKLIMTKDFYNFYGRGLGIVNNDRELLTKNLFALEGDTWRVLRQNLTPLFSSAKMKNMFYLMEQCGNHFESYIESRLKDTDEFEVRDLMSRLAMDVIGTCAFGLNVKSMDKEDSDFRKIGYKIFQPEKGKTLKNFVRLVSPSLFEKLKLTVTNPDVTNFFTDLSKKVIDSREGRPTERHDFVDLLAELKHKGHVEGDSIDSMKPGTEKKKIKITLDDQLLAAQSVVFFAAGFETSSTTVSNALRELALNPDIQKRLQTEIDSLLKKHNGKITYELVQEAKYLEKVISETGRKYPVLMTLTRECMNNYTLPNGFLIEKGVKIHIPVHALHYDPKYFPNPEIFDPERFEPNVAYQRPSHTYMPFGEGHRLCIGMRFGKLQVSVGLITILKNYNVERTSRTEDVIEYEPKSLITMTKNGIWLKLVPRHL